MGRILTGEKIAYGSATAVLLIAGGLPLLAIFSQTPLQEYAGIMSGARQWVLLRNSFTLALLTALLTAAAGVPLGVLLGKTDLPLRRVFTLLLTVPLLVPPYIAAISWFHVFGRNGVVARWLGTAAAGHASDWYFGLWGCVWVLSIAFLPAMVLLTIFYLRTVSARLEEAARVLAGWPQVLRSVTLPLIFPGVLLAASLVFLLALGEIGVPLFLRYDVYSVNAFIQFSAFLDFRSAAAASVPLALAAALILSAEWILLRDPLHQSARAFGRGRALRIRLGAYRWPLAALVALMSLVTVILPLLVLVGHSASAAAWAEAWWRAAGSAFRSVLFASAGASILTAVGFVIGQMIHTRSLGIWRGVDLITLILFVLPASVTGLGLISLWNRPGTAFLYGTPLMILFGYTAQYLALSSRATVAALTQIPSSMEESARMTGAGWARRTAFITAPMARHGIIAAWLITYIFCLRDLGVSMIVYPPGGDTLPVRIFTLMANAPESVVTALCSMMIALAIVPLGALALVARLVETQDAGH